MRERSCPQSPEAGVKPSPANVFSAAESICWGCRSCIGSSARGDNVFISQQASAVCRLPGGKCLTWPQGCMCWGALDPSSPDTQPVGWSRFILVSKPCCGSDTGFPLPRHHTQPTRAALRRFLCVPGSSWKSPMNCNRKHLLARSFSSPPWDSSKGFLDPAEMRPCWLPPVGRLAQSLAWQL